MDPILQKSFNASKHTITSLAFHPNGTQLAASSTDGPVVLYSLNNQRAFKFLGHQGSVYDVDFHPNAQVLGTAGSDQTVKLWTPSARGTVKTFKAHSGAVRGICFHSDGERFMTCSDDKSIKEWSLYRNKFIQSLNGHQNWVRTCAYSPDGKLIVSGSDDLSLRLWDRQSGQVVHQFMKLHEGMITKVIFHPSGYLIGSASLDGTIHLLDIRAMKILQHYSAAHTSQGKKGVSSVAFGGPAGEWLLSTGNDGLVKLWDLSEGHLCYTMHGHPQAPTTSCAFSQQRFASGGAGGHILLWEAPFLSKEQQSPVAVSEGKQLLNHNREESKMTDFEDIAAVPDLSTRPIEAEDQDAVLHGTKPTAESIPEISNVLSQLVKQLEILTRTMGMMEDRLWQVEEKLSGRGI